MVGRRDQTTGRDWTERLSNSILIVEDEPSLREALAAVLGGAGLRVYTVADGREAIRVLCDHCIDAVLLDLAMQGMDGITLLELVRQELGWTALGIVVFTGAGDVSVLPRLRELGVDSVLTKGRSSNEAILAAIERAIERQALGASRGLFPIPAVRYI